MSQGIPVISCGRGADVMIPFSQHMAPEYDVIHGCLDHASEMKEVPTIISGAQIPPSSGLGSNTSRPRSDWPTPKAVLFGAGVTEAEVEEVKKACDEDAVSKVKFVHILPTDARAATGENRPEKAANATRAKLKEVGL